VLTAEREHRATVVSLCPRASRRTFTLREFARLLAPVDPVSIAGTDPVERARELVAEAAANRGLVPVERPDDDDLADPIGRHVNYFRETATLVGAALDAFLSRL
jgi:protein-tyrosine phosphatase